MNNNSEHSSLWCLPCLFQFAAPHSPTPHAKPLKTWQAGFQQPCSLNKFVLLQQSRSTEAKTPNKPVHMGGCQNYGPFLGTLNIRCRSIIGIPKGTIILTTTHIRLGKACERPFTKLSVLGVVQPKLFARNQRFKHSKRTRPASMLRFPCFSNARSSCLPPLLAGMCS